jgi:putative serine protease PepD
MRAHPIAPIEGAGPRPAPPPVATLGGGRRRARPWGTVVVAGTAGAVLAGVGVAVLGVGEQVVERPVTERVALESSASVLGAPDQGADGTAATRQRTAPTVVQVEATGSGDLTGSGVVVRDDGVVITSAALVAAGALPVVRLSDGSTPAVQLTGVDPTTGLAVLDLAGGDYTPSVLATSDALAGGDTVSVLAGDDPGTTTADGVVGDPERFVGPLGNALDGIEVSGDAATAALGGPVTDARGAVLGITTAVADGDGWFAVPIAVADRVANDLLSDGVARHCRLGIEGTEPASDDPADHGTLVASVVQDSPAALGGIRPGDVVVALDGDDVADMADLLLRLRAYAPGDRVEVTVARDEGSTTTLLIRLDEASVDQAPVHPAP